MKHTLIAIVGLGCMGLGGCVETTDPDPDTEAVARSSHDPAPGDEAFANDVADAMIDRIVALLFREFAVTTPDNAEVGKAAISNVFHNGNPTMRLVGDVEPLQDTNFPRDSFEEDALAAAKLGNNLRRTERDHGRWYARESLAVSTAFSPSCVFCHPAFEGLANPWVGALMVKVEIK